MALACTLQEFSTSGVALATGLTSCAVLLVKVVRGDATPNGNGNNGKGPTSG